MIPLVFENVKMFICVSIGATLWPKGCHQIIVFFVHQNRAVFITHGLTHTLYFEMKP